MIGTFLLVVTLIALMFGIWSGFAGRVWGMYVAYGAFVVLALLWALLERVGWRRIERQRSRHRTLGPLRRLRRRPVVLPAVQATTHRERMRHRPPDVLEQAGSLLLGILVVVVVLGGAVWAMRFLLSR